jgi:hypothetical protein
MVYCRSVVAHSFSSNATKGLEIVMNLEASPIGYGAGMEQVHS